MPVSPGSLSRWLRDIELNDEQRARIHQKNLASRQKFVEFAQRKHRTSQLEKSGLMMRWFRECCNVSEQKFRIRVQLYDAAHRQHIEQFWSQVTGISTQQFTKPILKLSPSSQRTRGNPLPYGTLHLRIAGVHLLTKIQGWMKGLSLAPSSSPAQDVSFSG